MIGSVTSEAPLRVRPHGWDEEHLFSIVREPFGLPRLCPMNAAIGAVVMRNPDWDAAWGDENIHPPKLGSGTVVGFTDFQRRVKGDIDSGGEYGALASVLWEGDPEPLEYRIGFADEYWLSLLSDGAEEPAVDDCYCLLSDAQQLMAAFGRFPEDEVTGWSAAKQARCGQPAKVTEVYDDFSVNLCFFSDDAELIVPQEALDPKISEGNCIGVLADVVKLAGAFGRFPDDATNGWSAAKQDRFGQAGRVMTVYTDATVTLRFLSDEAEMDFPFEALDPETLTSPETSSGSDATESAGSSTSSAD